MIRNATENDFARIYEVINDAAFAYKGIIPADRWRTPYMPEDELREQIEDGVEFTCYIGDNEIAGVMGIQDKEEVNLIRHAYVSTKDRQKGIRTALLQHLMSSSEKPVLIGTWKAADWAIRFYQKHGFALVPEEEKNSLLRKFWNIPTRQVETSVVLADTNFRERQHS